MESKTVSQDEMPIDIEEVEEITGYKKSYIYRLAAKKTIPVHKMNGGKLRFFKSELIAWIKGETAQPQAAA